jgi:hypothetical protein
MRSKVITLMVALAGTGSAGLAVGAERGQEGAGTATQGDSPSGPRRLGGETQEETATATVQSVDRANRTVTLKDEKGKNMTVDVPSEVQSFDKLKKGDKVRMTYRESIAVAVHRPGEAKPSSDTQESRGRTTGANPTGNVERTHTVSAEVVSVDTARNKLTVKGADGKTREIGVQDPKMRDELKGLTPGEVVEVKYTEAMAITLEPKK